MPVPRPAVTDPAALTHEHFLADAETRQAIEAIQQRYKLAARADAIRLALIVVASSPRLAITPPEPRKRGPKPKPAAPKPKPTAKGKG